MGPMRSRVVQPTGCRISPPVLAQLIKSRASAGSGGVCSAEWTRGRMKTAGRRRSRSLVFIPVHKPRARAVSGGICPFRRARRAVCDISIEIHARPIPRGIYSIHRTPACARCTADPASRSRVLDTSQEPHAPTPSRDIRSMHRTRRQEPTRALPISIGPCYTLIPEPPRAIRAAAVRRVIAL